MGPNRRNLDRHEKTVRAIRRAKAVREAKRVVAIWNARHAGNRELWFYPTIGAAITAGCPWLRFYCPACRQIGEVDLRNLDRHHRATIESLITTLSCRRCQPNLRDRASVRVSRSQDEKRKLKMPTERVRRLIVVGSVPADLPAG